MTQCKSTFQTRSNTGYRLLSQSTGLSSYRLLQHISESVSCDQVLQASCQPAMSSRQIHTSTTVSQDKSNSLMPACHEITSDPHFYNSFIRQV